MAKENGKKLGAGAGLGLGLGAGGEGEEIRVVFDGEGEKLKAVLKELDERRKRGREEKRRKEKEAKLKEANASLKSTSTPTPNAGQTPMQMGSQWRSQVAQSDRQFHPLPQHQRPSGPQSLHSNSPHLQSAHLHPPHPINGRPLHPSLPLPPHANPQFDSSTPSSSQVVNGISPSDPSHGLPMPARVRRPPPALVRARIMTSKVVPANSVQSPRFPSTAQASSSHSSSSTPAQSRGRQHHHLAPSYSHHYQSSPVIASRSPSPISRRPGQSNSGAKQKEHESVVEELARNGMDHVKIDGHGAQLGGAVRGEDVRQFFEGFKVDKVRCHLVPGR